MAKSVKKIVLGTVRDIPFNKLVLSQANVRRIKAGISVEELAADIARRGLLQSLLVRPVLDAAGEETGMFEVPAGGRRFRALEKLVKDKRLAKDTPVPCMIRDANSPIAAEDDSLAENTQRVALHPLDQYRAFKALSEKGQPEEDIAAAFFVPVSVVRQRLKLTTVSEKLLDLYAEDAMTLEELMAFTVSGDHTRQEQVWDAMASGHSIHHPWQIRRALTEGKVRASDKRALFVGIDAYTAAGGSLTRDLFENDDGGWLDDVALLERLAAEKLRTVADEIAGEGWKWVDAAISHGFDSDYGMRHLRGTETAMSAEEEASLAALRDEQARLESEYEQAEELPEEIDHRMGEIEAAITRLEERPVIFDAAEIVRAGTFVSIDADGDLLIERGYVRAEDDMPPTSDVGDGDTEGEPTDADGEAVDGESDNEPASADLPERLRMELSAHRTLALRDRLAQEPQTALTLLLHRLVAERFGYRYASSCLDAAVRPSYPVAAPDDLASSPSAKAIDERHAGWEKELPADEAALWDWLANLDDASRLALLAHCVSHGINAHFERFDRNGGVGAVKARLAAAAHLADAVGLDMAEAGWRPGAANYFSRVTKARILAAVSEAKNGDAARQIADLKKPDMAARAEMMLAGTGWLPEPLRGPAYQLARAAQPDGAEPTAPLPDRPRFAPSASAPAAAFADAAE